MIARTLQQGVKMICVGTDLEMSKKAVELAEGQEGIWASVGLHPNDNLHEVLNIEGYQKLLAHPKVVAVGEVGLDYYRTTGEENIVKQKDRFIKFLELAREAQKPLILHCREAYQDMLEMISAAETLFGGSAVRGVLHSFTSTWVVAQKFIDLGFYIGLNGIITFTEQYDETVKNIPLDKLLLETDAPYLSPAPHRGQRNEPAYVEWVAKKIAQTKDESLEKVAEATTSNAKKLFAI
jgi:TatD DNase family protein